MKKLFSDMNTRRIIITAVVLLVLLAACTWLVMPYLQKLADPAVQVKVKDKLHSFGGFGYLVVVLVQIAQIVIAFIPGEPIELLAGVMYGGFGGLLVCLIGCVIGSAIVFMLSKRFGTRFVERFFMKKKLDEFSFLKDSRKLEMVVFVLFLIPGTPKDMLTYVAGTTPMNLFRFLTISTFARIPSIVSSTFIGSSLLNSQWVLAVLIFVATAAIGVFGIIYRDRMIDFCKRHHHTRSEADMQE